MLSAVMNASQNWFFSSSSLKLVCIFVVFFSLLAKFISDVSVARVVAFVYGQHWKAAATAPARQDG